MAMWTSLVLLALAGARTLSFPQPGNDGYKIPEIPNSKRTQYYILHDDGSFKYGYDTGSGQYESAMKQPTGDITGFYGYKDSTGESRRIDYTAGVGGFVPDVADQSSSFSSNQQVVLKSKPVEINNNHIDQAVKSESFEPRGDASYSFSYQTGDSSRSESSDADLNVVGKYSFVADDGIERTVNYKAGSSTGFISSGSHLPVAPEVHGVPAATVSPAVRTSVSQASSSTQRQSSAGASHSGDSTSFEPRGDASYSFSYQSGDSSRSESSDADLNVVGQYSFVADDGIERTVDYKAGSASGFIASGSHLPVAPEAPVPAPAIRKTPSSSFGSTSTSSQTTSISSSEPRGDASYSFSYQSGDSSRSESSDSDLNVIGKYSFVADDGIERTVDYKAGSSTGFVASGLHLPVAPEVPIIPATSVVPSVRASGSQTSSSVQRQSSTGASHTGVSTSFEPKGDAAYSFSYQTGDSSRSESSDADLNVVGKYSFVADDGIKRTVDYSAGSSSGFIASGSHLPVAPEVHGVPAAPVSPAVRTSVPQASSSTQRQSSAGDSHSGYSTSFEPRGDASYSFSYQSGDSSRSESSDADLNVVGKYSFVADDGIERTVDYKAGSASGFVVSGSHLPVAPRAPVPVPTVRKSHSSSHGSSSTSSQISSISSSEPRGDASYSFSYQTGDSSRSESSDSDLNVIGKYSFVADDGIERTVDYKAGSSTGFVASGSHLPVAPEVPAVPAAPAVKSSVSQGSSQRTQSLTGTSTSGVSTSYEPRGDASYSFSYQSGDSSRSESSDADLNVVGKFSFVADDGIERTVDYKAGSSTGFIASGSHLPVAPEVPVVPAAPVAPAVRTSQAFSSTQRQSSAGASHSGVSTSFEPRGDASYSFSYQSGDSSRSESSDADLNVVGKYSFVADDGIERTVDYKAGSSTGFIASGSHLPVDPEVSVLVPTVKKAPSPTAGTSSVPSHSTSISSSEPRGDASYSFNYQSDDSSRFESSDANLNVIGKYSFIADDGIERTVDYQAGSLSGFVATGSHLPVGPEAPSVLRKTHATSTRNSQSSKKPSLVSVKTNLVNKEQSKSVKSSFDNIELHQYPPGNDKYGYVFIEH